MDSMVTTISLSEETKEKLRNLGRTGESYDDIIKKMYKITKKHLLLAYLYDTSDSVSVHEALAEAQKRWP